MEWNGEKLRSLRLRMGWTQSDLARRLHVESEKIDQLEMGTDNMSEEISQALDLLDIQAEAMAEDLFCGSLSEILFDEEEVLQVDTSSIRRKILDQ